MKLISYSSAVALALITAPVSAWADANPDFDDDAKPILKAQPGLIQYIQSHFQVKDTGTAKYPGDDDRRPIPPYIFRARPVGSEGPYNLRLLIQPGAPGHILNVVDMNKVRSTEPGSHSSVASHPPQPPAPPESAYAPEPPAAPQPPQSAYAPEPPAAPATPQPPAPPVSSTPAPAAPSTPVADPTADTPSGPIMSGSSSNLAPPPDPARLHNNGGFTGDSPHPSGKLLSLSLLVLVLNSHT